MGGGALGAFGDIELHLLTFGALSPQVAFNVTVVLCWSLYPLTTFVGARRLGLDRTQALVCALLAPLVSSKLKFGFTIHSLMGLGLYTQHYAMLLFPLALGTLWQAVEGYGETAASRRRRVISAGGLLVLICLSHAFYGVVLATSGVIMVLVRPREVFRQSLLSAAPALILVHNHPSGDPAPSREDVAITRQLVQAGDLLWIRVLDHLVVAAEGFASLRDRGLMSRLGPPSRRDGRAQAVAISSPS